MHDGGIAIDDELVGELLGDQFPQWAGLPRFEVHSFGTVHTIYRLGEDLAIRLPRMAGAEGAMDKELAFLPELGHGLPLEVPVPLATGVPSDAYPFSWQVTTWVEGETAPFSRLASPREDAGLLGRFIGALQRLDPVGGPPPGAHNSWRGAALSSRDDQTRRTIMRLGGELNLELALATWDAALEADEDGSGGVWIHGDLLPTNLVSRGRRLAGVIDFGCLCVGDPACDVMAAWTTLDATTRDAFREQLAVDDETWTRGRGWALSFAVIALPYYLATNPVLVAIARHAIREALSDNKRR
jgi:aminoglycoside phosphotransferase (APT) family kinase protein